MMETYFSSSHDLDITAGNAADAYDDVRNEPPSESKPFGDPCPLKRGEPGLATLASADNDNESEGYGPPTLHTMSEAPPRRSNNNGTKRKEVEARRFTGKENVEEYLLQFELTSRRNKWDDAEKSSALLCALDGPARGLFNEFEDPISASYADVKEALLRRYGPTKLVEVHEQALGQLRLQKGQNIRELAQEIQRLVKKAYPDIVGPPRERLAVKHLIGAVHDKDAVFYMREKDPKDVTQACQIYERYVALVNEDVNNRRSGVRGINDIRPNSQPPPAAADPSALQRQTAEAIELITATTNAQLQKLTDALSALSTPAGREHIDTSAHPRTQPPRTDIASPPQPDVPRKPCPRCGMAGHWAKDCVQRPGPPPVPGQSLGPCFRCKQPGHVRRQCTASLNFLGPAPAPGTGARPPHRQ